MRLRSRSRTYAVLLALLLLYWVISLHQLDVTPPVYEDEPWQASTGWKLAADGVFGSDMFSGFYGMESRYYGFLPVFPLLLAGTFRLIGLGLYQARLVAVVMGLLTLVLTYSLGNRLFRPSVGLLAVILMLFLRLTVASRYQGTGILALDFARIARYDAVVPVFGLASLHAYRAASLRRSLGWFGLAGFLAGVAGLSHLYGIFWLAVLVVLILWDRDGWRALLAVSLGFGLAWLPYLIYVLRDLPDWKGQTSGYAPRFDLLNPRWYLDNLLREPDRYRLLAQSGSRPWLRPGLWALLLLLPLSLLGLARNAVARGDRAARILLTPTILLLLLFALLITLKLVNYAITVMPLLALTLAWGAVALWCWASSMQWQRWIRAGLVILTSALVLEGAIMMGRLQQSAAKTTPYSQFIAEVRQSIPAGSRVLGLHTYWFGLSDLEYRSWAVPIFQSDPTFGSPPKSLSQALDDVAPDTILIDPRMRGYLTALPRSRAAAPQDALAWMAQRGFERVAKVDDPTYGLMEIYQAPGH